jgi:hypothetical protein
MNHLISVSFRCTNHLGVRMEGVALIAVPFAITSEETHDEFLRLFLGAVKDHGTNAIPLSWQRLEDGPRL